MPSPFPGMDPYLENPVWWRDLHNRMITYVADTLNSLLPPGYLARMDERLYVVEPTAGAGRDLYPDVAVLERDTPPTAPTRAGSRESMATLDPPFAVTVAAFEQHERFIEIVAGRGDDMRVITALELISPANKTPGTGRDSYLRKQRETLQSRVHLIEIDLLRRGEPLLPPPPPMLVALAPYDYAISRHRSGDGPRFDVWLRTVRERLPRFGVPLAESDPDVELDLQQVFDHCYDAGRYREFVDYAGESVPPLSPADAEWADERLRSRGLREGQ